MATTAMAGAAGAAVVMYYSGWNIPWGVFKARISEGGTSEEKEGDLFVGGIAQDIGKRRVVVPIIARAPSTWFESLSTISETLRFTYSETLGKWPIGDLAFGINYLLKRQSNEHVAQEFANGESQQIDGLSIMVELREYLRVLLMCMHFSKKPYPKFLDAIGFKSNQVLLEEGKAGILKPAFTLLLDNEHHCILLLIRGTHSVKDSLTSLTGAVVPFHHTIFNKDGINKLVLGYAHCGMVAAARWIATKSSNKIIEALKKNPTYQLKIVGHSLGGGTAALLSYILREQNICANIHCICFGPAACMTSELAESGSEFVTTIINGCDLVPCFSSGSLDDLRAEVTASAWANDFRQEMESTRILRTMFRSASALKCQLQTIASISRAVSPPSLIVSRAAQTGVARVGAIWRPVSSGTRGIVKQTIAAIRRPSLMNWAFSTPRTSNRVEVATVGTETLDISELNFAAPFNENAERMNVISNTTIGEDEVLGSTNEVTSNVLEEIGASQSSSQQTFETDEIANKCSEDPSEDTVGYAIGLSSVLSEENVANFPQFVNATGDITESVAQLEVEDELEQTEEPTSPNSGIEEIGENLLWHQVAQEFERQQHIAEVEAQHVHKEEEEVAKEIIQEETDVVESVVATEIETEQRKSKVQIDNKRHFFPPGRIMHLVGPQPMKVGNQHKDFKSQQQVGLYFTKRNLYGKIRLSRTMVHDHYMPTYKRVIESTIEQFETQAVPTKSCSLENFESGSLEPSFSSNLEESGE